MRRYVNLGVAIEIELREAPADDPVSLRLAEAMRNEVEERGAHNGAARPNMELSDAIRADSDRIVAYAGQEPVGIGALRLLGTGTAEIKRSSNDARAGMGSARFGWTRTRGWPRRTACTWRRASGRSRTTTRIRGQTAGMRSPSPEFP